MTLAVALLLAGPAMGAPGVVSEEAKSEMERAIEGGPEMWSQYIDAAVHDIATALDDIDRLLDAAKNGGSAQVVQCISPRRKNVDTLKVVAEDAQAQFASAYGVGDLDLALHQFRKTAVAQQRAMMLLAEAERCTGGQRPSDGQTIVKLAQVQDEVDMVFDAFAPLHHWSDSMDVGFDLIDVSPFR